MSTQTIGILLANSASSTNDFISEEFGALIPKHSRVSEGFATSVPSIV